MDYRKKLGYLKGLSEGLSLDASTKEGKLLLAIVDTLDAMVLAMEDMEDAIEDMDDAIDDLNDDMETLTEAIEDLEADASFDEEEARGGDIRLFRGHRHDEEETYELACPACGRMIEVDEDALDEGGVVCLGCGKKLEFEYSCGCGGCHDEDGCGGDDEDGCCCGGDDENGCCCDEDSE